MLLPWSSSICFHSRPACPLLTYTHQPSSSTYSLSPSSSRTISLKENLSKLLLSPPPRNTASLPVYVPTSTRTTTRPTSTPITFRRSAPVKVPIAKASSGVKPFNGSYPPDRKNKYAGKITPGTCTNPIKRKLNNVPISLLSLPPPDTRKPCSKNIQFVQSHGIVNDVSSRFTAASTSNCSFPPDPVPQATFSYSEIPFLDDLQLENEGNKAEQDHENLERTMGYLRLRRTQQKSPSRRLFEIKISTVDAAYSPSSSTGQFSPSLSPSSFFAPTIPPAVHLIISRRNLPPGLYESVQRIHDAVVSGVQPPLRPKSRRTPLNCSNGQDPPPRSQIRDIRSNSAHYLMHATETRMILAQKLAAPLKSRAVLPRRTVPFVNCGSRLAATAYRDS